MIGSLALLGFNVSIHAPVKGRLIGYLRAIFEAVVSIHAPVKGRP